MDTALPELSESIETYLVTILRQSPSNAPVPLSRLARALEVSPISVNQMCRRLQDQGLVSYQPYKGVSCTPAGRQVAVRILRRHRLWEVFLVDHLEMAWEEAHDAACRLEHSTPDDVIERLDLYLGRPQVNPQGDPIPTHAGELAPAGYRSLAEVEVGQRVYFVRCAADESVRTFLRLQGLRAGAPLHIDAVAAGGLLIEVNGEQLAIDRPLAEQIIVGTAEGWQGSADAGEPLAETTPVQHRPLAELHPGQSGVVVRVGGAPRLRGRLLEMGLVPGEEVIVRQAAPLGDPIELEVKGYRLSLRRAEAQEIIVEMEVSDVETTTGRDRQRPESPLE
jgi:DtxR family Mn-dependent transcriptional regulator